MNWCLKLSAGSWLWPDGCSSCCRDTWSQGQSSPGCQSSWLSAASPAAGSRWPPQSPWSGGWLGSGWKIQIKLDFTHRNLQFAVQIWLLFAKNWKKYCSSDVRWDCCVNILYLRDCSWCKNKVSLCRFSNDSMVAFKPIEANISNDFISFIFNTPGGALWCKSILSSIHAPPLNTRKAYLYLSITRQVIPVNMSALH